jgi:hypothetical protein
MNLAACYELSVRFLGRVRREASSRQAHSVQAVELHSMRNQPMGIVLLLIALSAALGHTQGRATGTRSPQPKTDPTASSPPPTVCNCVVHQEPIRPNGDVAKRSSYIARLFAPDLMPNVVLSIIGIAGVIVALCTLRKLERQTKANEDAAKAALLQSQHLASSERGWLFVDKGKGMFDEAIQEPYLLPVGHPDVRPNQERISHCIFFIRNAGKTPAKITGLKVELQIGDSPSDPPDAMAFEIGGETFNPYFIPQEAVYPYEARLKTGFATWKEFQAVEDHIGFLWLCGVVRYEDIFAGCQSAPHEMTFCYMWETRLNIQKPIWKTASRPEFNRGT